MAEICIKIPEELKKRAEESSLDISSIVIKAIEFKSESEEIKRFKEIVSKSQLKERDAKELSEKVKESMKDNLKKKGYI